MEEQTVTMPPRNSARDWLLVIAVIFFEFAGFILALICIYSLPDKSVQPLPGAAYFISSSLLAMGLLLYLFKREDLYIKSTLSTVSSGTRELFIRESVSNTLLRWIVVLTSLLFILESVSIAMICIYALPDKSVQPLVGGIYFICGAAVLSTLVVLLWKQAFRKKNPPSKPTPEASR